MASKCIIDSKLTDDSELVRVQSFSVLCIPTRGTHITSDMCAGVHISRGYTYHCDTGTGKTIHGRQRGEALEMRLLA